MAALLGGCGGSVAIDFVGADGGNGSGGAGGSGTDLCPEGQTLVDGECIDDGVDPGPEPEPGCDLTNIKFDQLNPRWQGGFQSVVMLRNVSETCTVDLDGLSLGVRSEAFSSVPLSGPLDPDAIFTIASETIGRVVDQTAPEVSFSGNNAWFTLCVGDCDPDDGSNVVDLVVLGQFDGVSVVAPQTPAGISFDGVALARMDGDTERYGGYYRSNVSDDFFTTADWSAAVIIDPSVGGDGTSLKAIGTPPVLSSQTDPTFGSYFLFSNESGVSDTYDGFEATGPYGFRPRYVTGRFFAGPGLVTAFVIGGTGSPTDSSAGAIHIILDGTGLTVNGYPAPFDTPKEAWVQVEFQNIDWSTGFFDVWLDGTLLAADVPMNPAFSEGLIGDVVGVYAVGGGNATGFTELYLVE